MFILCPPRAYKPSDCILVNLLLQKKKKRKKRKVFKTKLNTKERTKERKKLELMRKLRKQRGEAAKVIHPQHQHQSCDEPGNQHPKPLSIYPAHLLLDDIVCPKETKSQQTLV